jgi:hypothetical protein
VNFAHSPTLPISPIFSEFNPAQESHAAHLAHFAQKGIGPKGHYVQKGLLDDNYRPDIF